VADAAPEQQRTPLLAGAQECTRHALRLVHTKVDRELVGLTDAGVPAQRFGLEVPRVSQAELAANATLLGGGHAFILTGVASSWPAMEAWAGEVGRALARLWTVLVRA
jgi:hypothetical protein